MKEKTWISLAAGALLLLLALASLRCLMLPKQGTVAREKCLEGVDALLDRESFHIRLGERGDLYRHGEDRLVLLQGEGWLQKDGRVYTLGLAQQGPVWDYSPGYENRDPEHWFREIFRWQEPRYEKTGVGVYTLTAREGTAKFRFDLLGRLREIRKTPRDGEEQLAKVLPGRTASRVIAAQDLSLCREFTWQAGGSPKVISAAACLCCCMDLSCSTLPT